MKSPNSRQPSTNWFRSAMGWKPTWRLTGALISPARKLHLDILQSIFVACLPTHRNCVMSATEAPVLLGHICSSWRSISLSTPRLWTRLHVAQPMRGPTPMESSFEQKVVQRIEVTKTWLGRSGQCPLSISFHCPPENVQVPPPVVSRTSIQFLQALIPFAARWQHIHLTTPTSSLLEVMSHVDIDIPWLETVAFHHQPHSFDNELTWESSSFGILRGAQISSLSFPGSIFKPDRLPLAWNQLTTLTIGGPWWTISPELTSITLLDLLSRCHKLQCCKLMVRDLDLGMPVAQHPIVELPFLHTLAVHCVSMVAPAVSILLKRLSLPELRNFAFISGANHQGSPTLADFFARSTRLEGLDLDCRPFSKSTFLESLHSLPPSIQRLRICDPDRGWGNLEGANSFDDETLTALTSSGICPALQHLSIDHGDHISDEAILQFITARRLESQTTLKRVDIYFRMRQMTLDVMPSLQPFIEAGLTVSLIYPPPFPLPQQSPWDGLADAPQVSPPGWPFPPMLEW
ncbi:hypothetical protein MVEN_00593700 [Mycena venus]|uniref:F-box domain-containing protein n=1 Tax=Mycena venus TaxID=2733690 RepID=A0A8H6YPI7_9AGAR|nr:hypothetical protein MVEN_00593700 [Mycena venus]